MQFLQFSTAITFTVYVGNITNCEELKQVVKFAGE